MRRFGIPLLGLALGLASCSATTNQGEDVMVDDRLREDMKFLAGKKLFFGHQSVGHDIMAGVRDLAAMADMPSFRVLEMDDSTRGGDAFFVHGFVGENGEPNAKCDDFLTRVDGVLRGSLDVALMKFCYADIRKDRDVDAMFDYYRTTMDRLIAEHPSVTFVHVTVPVTVRSVWWKRFGRAVLGKEDPWDAGSTRQFEFNQKLRSAYAGQPLFDLAKVESTHPDGRVEEFEYKGKPASELVQAYTYDGGHLNEYGRKVVAKQLLHTLADILRKRG